MNIFEIARKVALDRAKLWHGDGSDEGKFRRSEAEIIAEQISKISPEKLQKLLHECIRRKVGEHDMVECKICDQSGHNEILGHYYGIKHKPDCSFLALVNLISEGN